MEASSSFGTNSFFILLKSVHAPGHLKIISPSVQIFPQQDSGVLQFRAYKRNLTGHISLLVKLVPLENYRLYFKVNRNEFNILILSLVQQSLILLQISFLCFWNQSNPIQLLIDDLIYPFATHLTTQFGTQFPTLCFLGQPYDNGYQCKSYWRIPNHWGSWLIIHNT